MIQIVRMEMVGMMKAKEDAVQTQISLNIFNIMLLGYDISSEDIETYTFIRKCTYVARSISNVPLRVVNLGDPHGQSWQEGGEAGDGDTDLDDLEAGGRLVVVTQREFERQQAVEVDEDEEVDGAAEQDDLQAGHHVTHLRAKSPPRGEKFKVRSLPSSPPPLSVPVYHVRVDGDDDAGQQIYHSQRNNYKAESLAK